MIFFTLLYLATFLTFNFENRTIIGGDITKNMSEHFTQKCPRFCTTFSGIDQHACPTWNMFAVCTLSGSLPPYNDLENHRAMATGQLLFFKWSATPTVRQTNKHMHTYTHGTNNITSPANIDQTVQPWEHKQTYTQTDGWTLPSALSPSLRGR